MWHKETDCWNVVYCSWTNHFRAQGSGFWLILCPHAGSIVKPTCCLYMQHSWHVHAQASALNQNCHNWKSIKQSIYKCCDNTTPSFMWSGQLSCTVHMHSSVFQFKTGGFISWSNKHIIASNSMYYTHIILQYVKQYIIQLRHA